MVVSYTEILSLQMSHEQMHYIFHLGVLLYGLTQSFNLDLSCTRQLEAAPFYENYTKLYFDATTQKRNSIEGGEIFAAILFKKVPFLANIGRLPNFAEYPDSQVKINYQKQCLKYSKLYTLLLDALKTATKYFDKSPHHYRPKAISTECIKAICHWQRIICNSFIWSNKFYQRVLRRLYLSKIRCEDNDSIIADCGFTIIKK